MIPEGTTKSMFLAESLQNLGGVLQGQSPVATMEAMNKQNLEAMNPSIKLKFVLQSESRPLNNFESNRLLSNVNFIKDAKTGDPEIEDKLKLGFIPKVYEENLDYVNPKTGEIIKTDTGYRVVFKARDVTTYEGMKGGNPFYMGQNLITRPELETLQIRANVNPVTGKKNKKFGNIMKI